MIRQRKMIVAANKTDILTDRTLLEKLKAHVEGKGMTFFELSAATHQGVRELMKAAAGELAHLPPVITYEPEYVERPPQVDTTEPLTIRHEDDVWIVEGPWLQKIMANVNFSNYESRNWFDRMLRNAGLFDRLEEMGIKDGDLVSLYNLDFEYQRLVFLTRQRAEKRAGDKSRFLPGPLKIFLAICLPMWYSIYDWFPHPVQPAGSVAVRRCTVRAPYSKYENGGKDTCAQKPNCWPSTGSSPRPTPP